MITEVFKNILRFTVLLLLQVLIVRNMDFGNYMVPLIYVMFFILLPFSIPGWLLLLLGFFCGLIVDVFYSTMGMHTSACTFVAFVRPFVLRVLAPRDGYDANASPGIFSFGFTWYLSFASVLILAHHFVLFYLEVFRFSEFFSTFLRVIASAFLSLVLIIIAQFVIYRSKT